MVGDVDGKTRAEQHSENQNFLWHTVIADY
jgi:hypothetical protein